MHLRLNLGQLFADLRVWSVVGVLGMDLPLLRVPFEVLSRDFRRAQKAVEKEVQEVLADVQQLRDGPVTPDVRAALLAGAAKLRVLKATVSEGCAGRGGVRAGKAGWETWCGVVWCRG